jgi:transposase
MLYVGLDLSRKRLDWHALRPDGERVAFGAVPADADGLAGLVHRLGDANEQRVIAVIESMNGARFVHDRLELAGWDVRVADPMKCKGLAPLACKTDRIDAWVLAELARRDFVPELWLPDPAVRAERERVRFRLHLVKHRTQLKNRVHSILIGHGLPCPVTDLFGVRGRELLARLSLPEPWASTLVTSLALIDTLDEQISGCERELRALGADHPYVPLLLTLPGVGWIHAFTLSSEIGDIGRFPTPTRLIGYTGLNPVVKQSGESDWRGPLAKHGPRYLRWALVEAAHTAARQPRYRPIVQRQHARHGRRHGSKIAALVIGRKLAEAAWHMLTRNQPFAPAGATQSLTA